VGSAQRRSRRAFLQHGSIPLRGDQSLLGEIWPGSIEPERATSVSAAAGRRVEFAELAAALATAVAESLRVALEPAQLSDSELGGVCALLPAPALA
jgi:lipoate-protein ligase A